MTTIQTHIHIDTANVIGEVHDHLYGANFEHIGETIYQGAWAQMLRVRKFAEHDRAYIGLNEGLNHQNPGYGISALRTPRVSVPPTALDAPVWQPVNPDAAHVVFIQDNTDFYSGSQSQSVWIRSADDRPHGISQDGLLLLPGRQLELRLVLKGQGQMVRVQLGDMEWEIAPTTEHWTTHRKVFTPARRDDNACLSISASAVGRFWIGCVSLMPLDTVCGFRVDFVHALQHWSPTCLRWPGGNTASDYHWMDGVGDQDRRPSKLDPTGLLALLWESNDVGTHEFIDLCRAIGSEPHLTVNMGTGTPQEAADWVEYCNGDQSTAMGRLRATNGHAEPFAVRVWYVGNEQFGNWQFGHCNAETYARRYLEFARAMRAVDADLVLIAVGVPADLYGHWNELLLRDAGSEIDGLSVHYYSIRTEKDLTTPAPADLYLPKIAASLDVEAMLARTLELMARFCDPPPFLAFDEWNTYFGAKGPLFIEAYNIADALYVGSVTNTCLRHCDRIKLSAIYNLVNVMGNYRINARSVWKTPSTLVMELLTAHRGPIAIACQVQCPSIASPALGNQPAFANVPLIDAAVTADLADGKAYLSIVNRHPEQAAELTISGLLRCADATARTVSGSHHLAENTEEQPDLVSIETRIWPLQDQHFSLPAHSFTLLEIPVRP